MPVRVQRFRLWILRVDFNTIYVLGKNLVIADALSRTTLMAPDQHKKHFGEDVQTYMGAVVQGLSATEWRLEEIRLAQENDPLCQELSKVLLTRLARERMS